MLKSLVSRFRPDLSARLKDIVEKQVLAKLKLIVSAYLVRSVGNAKEGDISGQRGIKRPESLPSQECVK